MAARADCDSNARTVFDACFMDVVEDRKTLKVLFVLLISTYYSHKQKHSVFSVAWVFLIIPIWCCYKSRYICTVTISTEQISPNGGHGTDCKRLRARSRKTSNTSYRMAAFFCWCNWMVQSIGGWHIVLQVNKRRWHLGCNRCAVIVFINVFLPCWCCIWSRDMAKGALCCFQNGLHQN